MPELPIYLASDVHLGSAPPEIEPAFLAWLNHCRTHASRVIINGDLFDFWFEYGSAIPRGHTRVLGALAAWPGARNAACGPPPASQIRLV